MELTPIKIMLKQPNTDGNVCPVPCLVYIKDEADNVIAELKVQKAQAEDDCTYWKTKYNDCKRELDLLKDTNAFYNGGR